MKTLARIGVILILGLIYLAIIWASIKSGSFTPQYIKNCWDMQLADLIITFSCSSFIVMLGNKLFKIIEK